MRLYKDETPRVDHAWTHKNVRKNLKFNRRVSESSRFLAKPSICQTQSNGHPEQTDKYNRAERAVNPFHIFANIAECTCFPRTFDALLQFPCFRVLPFHSAHQQTEILLSTFHIIRAKISNFEDDISLKPENVILCFDNLLETF